MDTLRQQNWDCFICDKSILTSSDSAKLERLSVCKQFLKVSSRYLSIPVSTSFPIEPEKTLIKNFALKNLSVDAVAVENLNLDCCESCFLNVRHFCRFYDQWIQIKLRLDHYCKEIAAAIVACSNLKTENIQNDAKKKLTDETGLRHFKKCFVNRVKKRKGRIYPIIESERLPGAHSQKQGPILISNTGAGNKIRVSDPSKKSKVPHGHSCGFCGKMFSQRSNLRRHVRVHLAVKPFKCTYCDARFTKHRARVDHIRTHTGETPFNCKICGQSFKQKKQCRRHEKSVHNPKKIASDEKKPFKCHICNKGFLSGKSHRRHVRSHTGEKKWACNFCDWKFFRRQTLLDHDRGRTSGCDRGEKSPPEFLKGVKTYQNHPLNFGRKAIIIEFPNSFVHYLLFGSDHHINIVM